MVEVWKDVQGFNGVYQVSNYGNMRSISHVQHYTDSIGRNVTRSVKGKRLIPTPIQRGYAGVTLYDNGKKITKCVHTLVATAFIDNPNGLPQVNHKDENKLNNRVDNLEWCTCSYNINYGTGNNRRSCTLKSVRGKR